MRYSDRQPAKARRGVWRKLSQRQLANSMASAISNLSLFFSASPASQLAGQPARNGGLYGTAAGAGSPSASNGGQPALAAIISGVATANGADYEN